MASIVDMDSGHVSPDFQAPVVLFTATEALTEVEFAVDEVIIPGDANVTDPLAAFAIEHGVSGGDMAAIKTNPDLHETAKVAKHLLAEGRLASERGGLRALPHRLEQGATLLFRPFAALRAGRIGLLGAANELVQPTED